ncbi:MAG TPA: site-specific integrase [Sphingobium sp.]|uniref:tyrosine-type recombinase/integrase n=1 Tax=Sphingobium sp. TaxID=1912891 RepID=UPI002ED574DE
MISSFATPDRESPRQSATRREHLNGHVARRKFRTSGYIWDDELRGFALRHTAAGGKCWIVQYRHRREVKRVTLGWPPAMIADEARAEARRILAEAALDGLPVRPPRTKESSGISFGDYVPLFWSHFAQHWKPSTQQSNRAYIRNHLVPTFGEQSLASLTRVNVMAWRDGLARKEGAFNRAIPILSVMLGYAETLGYRPRGSNPCKGISRYRRRLKERYLSAREYQRLGCVLRDRAEAMPMTTAALWLLIYTGARKSEVVGLRWEWVGENFVSLPDSKTGPKRLYINRQAAKVLDGLGRTSDGRVLGSDFRGSRLDKDWAAIKSAAGLPDVRLHDLRHSFASVAIAHGISLTKLGGLLGHALPETTVRYAHLADDVIQEAASRVSGSMARALGLSQ